ncbi:MAG: type II toxin-antitoxin system RelE/ParE family toxin [Cyanobacteria bacterium P01_G01_bin.54]
MTYRIEISPTAMADVEDVFMWLQGYSVERAHRWVRGCYEAMLTLEKFPGRCPLAVESRYMQVTVRQLLYKKQYRILFTLVGGADDADFQGTVRINRVLRASQERLTDIGQLGQNN